MNQNQIIHLQVYLRLALVTVKKLDELAQLSKRPWPI